MKCNFKNYKIIIVALMFSLIFIKNYFLSTLIAIFVILYSILYYLNLKANKKDAN